MSRSRWVEWRYALSGSLFWFRELWTRTSLVLGRVKDLSSMPFSAENEPTHRNPLLRLGGLDAWQEALWCRARPRIGRQDLKSNPRILAKTPPIPGSSEAIPNLGKSNKTSGKTREEVIGNHLLPSQSASNRYPKSDPTTHHSAHFFGISLVLYLYLFKKSLSLNLILRIFRKRILCSGWL